MRIFPTFFVFEWRHGASHKSAHNQLKAACMCVYACVRVGVRDEEKAMEGGTWRGPPGLIGYKFYCRFPCLSVLVGSLLFGILFSIFFSFFFYILHINRERNGRRREGRRKRRRRRRRRRKKTLVTFTWEAAASMRLLHGNQAADMCPCALVSESCALARWQPRSSVLCNESRPTGETCSPSLVRQQHFSHLDIKRQNLRSTHHHHSTPPSHR